ncbi:ArdC family protein [Sedimentitalea sp. XS_ASV28]|uniref:ArdC family protein n=1 Tax=Sedimentitalea sp. XS_ASV28 TaxID=3241296 RepID=UPI003518CDB4
MAKSAKPRFDAAASITDELINIIDRGVLPWRKPWRVGGSSVPLRQNGEPYRGINNFLLTMRTMMAGYTSPYWMTLRQANALDAKIIKGSRSSVVVYYGTATRDGTENASDDEADADDPKAIPFMKSYRVFNADQIEGLDARFHPEPPDVEAYPERAPIPHMQAFFDAVGATVSFSGREACYVPALDKIYMPPIELFENPLNFYAVWGHELGHNADVRIMPRRSLQPVAVLEDRRGVSA